MEKKILTKEEARNVVLKAVRLFGTEHRGKTASGKVLGHYSIFHDVLIHHCDSCGEVNIVDDIIDVSAAAESGSYRPIFRAAGHDDRAQEEASALLELLEALDSIGFHLTEPLHPTGKCRCAGEGECEWCERNEERQAEQDKYDEETDG